MQRLQELKKTSDGEQETEVLWNLCRQECQAIFANFCTTKKRAYGKPDNFSIGGVEYQAEREKEPITAIRLATPSKVLIETKQNFGVGHVNYRCQYVLLKKAGNWLIDSKKVWGRGWEPTLL